jgi:hypothetical protein
LTVYLSFRGTEGDWNGLIRVSDAGATYERAGGDGWIEDNELARHVFRPGADSAEPIDPTLAQCLAERYGVEL